MSGKSLLIILNLWKCKGQLLLRSAVLEMFSIISPLYLEIDYTDLLSEISQSTEDTTLLDNDL